MAQFFPSDFQDDTGDRYENDELDTLVTLRDGLSDEYRIYHSVHWSRANPKRVAFGEIDFVVINNAGSVLVIEQKNGPLVETNQGLEKHYRSGKKKLVHSQVQRNQGIFRDKFKSATHPRNTLEMDYLIYCPDHRVVDVNAAGIDMSRTIDAASTKSLPKKVAQLLQSDAEKNNDLVNDLHNFLLSSFRIAPDVNAYKSNQNRVYCRLLEGLSEVIENLDFEPFRLKIVGTAGSGKTQVTMRFCERALEDGRNPLLLCFNRPLADKLIAQAPSGVKIDTYHGFVKEMVERAGVEIDFTKSREDGFWRGIQEQLLAATLAGAPKYDCLVVDEGQDFKADWYDIIQMFLTDDATQLWLEDPLQNLRGIDPIELRGFVSYRETANFRTPTSIAEFVKATLGTEFEQRNRLPGLGVALIEYETNNELQRTLDSRVNKLAKEGFGPEDIAIVSCRGMQSTALAEIDQIGKFKVRRFTGAYDSKNEQIYTDGELCFDTIFRFKGQQAPVVILVDLDETLDCNDRATAVLYCAMTRATVRLELVVKKTCPWHDIFLDNLEARVK